MAQLKVLLLLGLGVSVNAGVSLQKRIIGGHDCAATERLYHVRLTMRNATHTTICGGSLIHPQWILTAAQCWKSENGWITVAMLKVHPRTAIHQTTVIRDNPVVYAPEGWQHDIILLKLQRPVIDIPLAPLPDCSYHLKNGDTVQLAGEGRMTTGPNYQRLPNAATATHLHCVNMQVVHVSHFLLTYGDVFSTASPNKDACYGDVGGAVVFNGMIYGVISPDLPDYACQRPVFIMDVCKYMEWIKITTGIQ